MAATETDEKASKDFSKLGPDALFDAFINASQLLVTLEVFSKLCASVNIDPTEHRTVFQNLKARLTSWKCQTLWKKLDKRAELDSYKKKPCSKNNVLVIGCGPCGLRFAIEAVLLGANVVVTEKRDSFSRNNVLHLWPFLIYDLKNLGAKKFFGKFCAGSLDHISIRRLQLILLKVSLILGVQVYAECLFVKVKEPTQDKGWTAEVKPENHPLSQFEFDVVIGTDGRRHTLKGFKRKEFRGKLAIAITMNFVNRNTKAEASVEEISGVAFIFNQGFFQDLKEETGIDLENIVYYKDETHYFVMTAKKKSLLAKCVLKKDCPDPRDLLAKRNVDRECLLNYAREAAYFCTSKQLPHMDFAVNAQSEEDIAMFDFTSMYSAENAAMIFEKKGRRLLTCLAGDSLMEPFWPTGSGCARGFLSVFDAAWMMRGWGLGHTPIDLITEREGIYKLLAQTTTGNVCKNYDGYTIDPRSRYPNATIKKARKETVKHLYKIIENSLDDTLNEEDKSVPMDTDAPMNIKNRVSPDLLLSWCQKHTEGYKNVHIKDMSSSWKSGLGFCALIHKFRPDLINFERLNEDDVKDNNELAFSVAEKELGIPPQVSATEMAENVKTDMLTVVTYLTQYYEAFKDEKPVDRDMTGVETSPENKHKSPLSKLYVISRISMRTKKDKRKHANDVPVEKTSKKYKVAEEKKVNTLSPSDVQLTSFKHLKKQENGDIAASPSSSETSKEKTKGRIEQLADLVFGSDKNNGNEQVSETSAKKTIRNNRGSLGDSEHCHFCKERIFVFERLSAEGFFFHRKCFKCEHCEITLRLGNYGYVPPDEGGSEGTFYCKQHYRKIFYETPGKLPLSNKEEDLLEESKPLSRRSHSFANIEQSCRESIEKPIVFEETEATSPPRKVLKVPQSLRDEINISRESSAAKEKKPAEESTAVSPERCNVSVDSRDLSIKEGEKSEEAAKSEEAESKTTVTRKSAARKAVYNRYEKLEARPVRRSSISTTRKSDKGARRLFVHKTKARAPAMMASPRYAPPKPSRLHHDDSGRGAGDGGDAQDSEVNRRRRKNSKRAMYPLSMAFPDSVLAAKAVDIPLDGEGVPGSPEEGKRKVTQDLRDCLGETSPRKLGRLPSAAGELAGTKKHWSTYYNVTGATDSVKDEDKKPMSRRSFPPLPPAPLEVPPPSPLEGERTLSTLHEDRVMSPTSPKRHSWWPHIFGHKKEKTPKEEKVKEKKLKEGIPKSPKKDKKEKKKRKKEKKSKELEEDKLDNGVDGTDDAKSPLTSDVDTADGYYESSEEEELPEAIRLARAREKRYKEAEKNRQLQRQKKNEQFQIRLEMRQRQQKRLRIAQSIQRELGEIEVRQNELEKRGIIVEKKMQQLEPANLSEEHKLVLEWFDLVNRKNTLIRYESELVIRSNSIELEDQQQRLEQQIRELLMLEANSEDEQIKINQLTRELVDIVEQRNTLVELLEQDRKREQEEDEVFETMMASKGFSLTS